MSVLRNFQFANPFSHAQEESPVSFYFTQEGKTSLKDMIEYSDEPWPILYTEAPFHLEALTIH